MSENAFLRCGHCGALNSLPAEKIQMHPKCGKCKSILALPDKPIEATMANFENEVVRWPGPVLVEFWSGTCGVCSSLMPSIYDLARQRAGKLKIVLVNVEREFLLAQRFNVLSLPTFIIYRGGKLINRLDGGLARAKLEEWIDASTSFSFRF